MTAVNPELRIYMYCWFGKSKKVVNGNCWPGRQRKFRSRNKLIIKNRALQIVALYFFKSVLEIIDKNRQLKRY
jgi:hypothetical protein